MMLSHVAPRVQRFAALACRSMSSMRGIVVKHPGRASSLHLCELPQPKCRDDEVVISVRAAGVNRPDLLQRSGLYPAPKGASPHLGLEVAGTVAHVGARVTQWKVGDSVCALTNGGGYAEMCAVHAGHVLPIPRGFSYIQAAALPETTLTVWHNVFQPRTLKPGDALLVHGGSGGIGTTAIQIGKWFGLHVFTTAGSSEKCRHCESFGATAFNYHEEDWVACIREAGGVNTVLDMVGGPYFDKNCGVLKRFGRLVLIGFLGGPKADGQSLMSVMLKRLVVTGSTLRSQTDAEKSTLVADVAENVWPAMGATLPPPPVSAVFPLAEAEAAHALLQEGKVLGKVVLDVASGVECPAQE